MLYTKFIIKKLATVVKMSLFLKNENVTYSPIPLMIINIVQLLMKLINLLII